MKPQSILTLSLLALLLLASCSPVVSPAEPVTRSQPVAPPTREQQQAPVTQTPTTASEATPEEMQSEAPFAETPLEMTPAAPPEPVVTSRGPDLEATDPSTVYLASGDLQLVEFFRFT